MHPAVVVASLVFAASLVMAVRVASYRDKSDLHWLLLGVFASLMTWMTGLALRFSGWGDARLGVQISVFGVLAVAPLWLALASSYGRLRFGETRAFRAALFVPWLLTTVALVTNDAHGWMVRDVAPELLRLGAHRWAGPLLWAYIFFAWACGSAGLGIFFSTARKLVTRSERRRGFILAVAATLPAPVSALDLFGGLGLPFYLTPTALLVSLLILFTAVFRSRLLSNLPVGRRDVIEQLEDGVLMAGPSGMILDFNPAASRLLDPGRLGLRRRMLTEVLAGIAPEEKRPALRQAVQELAVRGEPVAVELRTPDDRRLAVTADRARDPSGKVAGLFAVLRDRTDERRFERLLRRTQRLQTVGTLAAGIAHEVNNPLAFIRANLGEIHRMGELVERGGSDGKLVEELGDLRQIAEETLDGIARIERIVGDMKNLAAEPEERERGLAPVDLNRVVRDAVRLANLHRKQVVDMKVLLEDRLPEIQGSSERLVQAVVNLLINAKQAVERVESPRISVATHRTKDALEIRVSDNGPGVGYEIQERIFDPFFTTKGPGRGTGLGLSISFDILREHGGDLEVRSHPRGGAVFVARLPLAGEPLPT